VCDYHRYIHPIEVVGFLKLPSQQMEKLVDKCIIFIWHENWLRDVLFCN
jgi:hypothetical protein